jgi:hypothetical protein
MGWLCALAWISVMVWPQLEDTDMQLGVAIPDDQNVPDAE